MHHLTISWRDMFDFHKWWSRHGKLFICVYIRSPSSNDESTSVSKPRVSTSPLTLTTRTPTTPILKDQARPRPPNLSRRVTQQA